MSSYIFNLNNVNGKNGFVVNGLYGADTSSSGDYLGSSIKNIGDFNADGYGDIIIGASGSDVNGLYSGQVYVIFGRSGILTHPLMYYL